MTKSIKSLSLLIFAIIFACGSITMMIFAIVNSAKLGEKDYAHNIVIKEIKSDLEQVNGINHHDVVLEGFLVNNTEENYELLTVEIVLGGVNNNSGDYTEFATSFVIEDFNAGTKTDFTNEKLRVGNRSGFVPETIEEVKILVNGEALVVPYEEITNANMYLFVGAVLVMFVSGVMFIKFFNRRNKDKNIENKI